MLHYTLNNEARYACTSWEEVSTADYVELQQVSKMEAVCLLAGLKLEELQQPTALTFVILELATDLFSTEPESYRPEWLPYSLGADSIGKLELCKMYLHQFAEQPELAMPYIYAVYAWPDEYDAVLSLSGAGFPAPLLERASRLPITDTIGTVAHVAQEIERIGLRYAPILDKETETAQLQAGVERFEKYGFFSTLVSYCSGNLARAAALVELPADVFYTVMCVDVERGEYNEKLQEIKQKAHV